MWAVEDSWHYCNAVDGMMMAMGNQHDQTCVVDHTATYAALDIQHIPCFVMTEGFVSCMSYNNLGELFI